MVLFIPDTIGNYLNIIYSFVDNIINMINTTISLFPEPFKSILVGFSIVFIALIIIKLIRGS